MAKYLRNPQCPHPHLNHCLRFDGDGIVRDGGDINTTLDAVLGHLRTARSGFRFMVTRFSTPLDLASRLEDRGGLVLDERCPVLALRIRDILHAPPVQVSPGYSIREALTLADVSSVMRTVYDVFNTKPPVSVDACVEFYAANIGTKRYPALRIFAAWSEESATPVATAVTWNHAGVLGVYNVATLAAHRRKGLARAVVAAALAAPACKGGPAPCDVAVLQSSPDALSLYESLGFRVADHWDIYIPPPTA